MLGVETCNWDKKGNKIVFVLDVLVEFGELLNERQNWGRSLTVIYGRLVVATIATCISM
jgi:hypothetical protein